MSDAAARLAALVKAETGLLFAEARRATLENRARELAVEIGATGLDQLTNTLEREGCDGPVFRRLLDRIITDETFWFRYPDHFETLTDYVIPAAVSRAAFLGEKTIRILSAGCSRGQEPYSIAMAIARQPEILAGRSLEIVAVDLSDNVLRVAREGIYQDFELRGLADATRDAYFLRDGTRWRLNDHLRAMVTFHRCNLVRPLDLGVFDVIFCRNVTIYFDALDTQRVLRGLIESLRPGGHLFTGHAESFQGLDVELRMLQMARSIVYRRSRGGGAGSETTGGFGIPIRPGGGSR